MKNSKGLFKITTKTIVATGLGAALFTVLFMFVKVPSWIPNTDFHTAYAIAAFFGALFGPVASGLIGLIGHALSDTILYGSPWWSWVIASGIACFVAGFAYKRTKAEEGELKLKGIITFNIIQILGHAIAWLVDAPLLDIAIYIEPSELVYSQGVFAAVMNSISTGVIGTLMLVIYSATRTKKGSLTKKEEAAGK